MQYSESSDDSRPPSVLLNCRPMKTAKMGEMLPPCYSCTNVVFVVLLGIAALLGCETEEPAAIIEPAAPSVTSGSEVREAQHPLGAHLEEQYQGGLEAVLERRYIRVLTSRSSFDYFLQKG